MKKLILLFIISFFFYSCTKKEDSFDFGPDVSETDPNPWQDNPYKVNVIYFVPNDLKPAPLYQERISKILLNGQKYYADNMERAGFGRKSFGLDLIDNKTVNIITINGREGKVAYPEENGDEKIEIEIEAYFNTNSTVKKNSEHYLVIIPKYNDDDMEPIGGPYFEVNKVAYVMDFLYLDRDYLGKLDGLTEFNIGSLLHELGHALGAAHNLMRPSLRPTLGAALMGEGNNTYGISTTSITPASAAQLSNTQTFSTVVRTDWYEEAQFEWTALKAAVANNSITITGNFTTDITVKDVVAWHDPEPFGIDEDTNNDYDAISWNTKTTTGNNFEFVCNLNDFEKKSGRYELRLGFLHENGYVTIKSFVYSFVNGQPIVDTIRP